MIVDKSGDKWIWVLPSEPRKPKGDIAEYLRHHGKWLIFSKDKARLDELARKLDPHVESGEISSVKYSREPDPMFGAALSCAFTVMIEIGRRFGGSFPVLA